MHDPISIDVADAGRRLDILSRRIGRKRNRANAGSKASVADEDLDIALEELRVHQEELRRQGEELAAADRAAVTAHRHYVELFEFAPSGYLVTDLHGTIREINRAAEALFRLPRSTLLRTPLAVRVSPAERAGFRDRLSRIARGAANEEMPLRLETVFERRRGSPWPAEVLAVRFTDPPAGPTGIRWIVNDLTERKEVETRMRQLAGRILQAQDEERRRLGRELHDGTAQVLAVLAMNLARLERSAGRLGRDARSALREAKALARRCMRELRTTSYLLHPPLLENSGLGPALRDFGGGFAQRSGLAITFDVAARIGRLPPDREMALFRVVQEALANVHRHSGSASARVRVYRSAGDVVAEVADRGRGLSPAIRQKIERGAGVGLTAMRERLAAVGGRLELRSDGRGLVLRARIPSRRVASRAAQN